jgi:hypothetical protein
MNLSIGVAGRKIRLGILRLRNEETSFRLVQSDWNSKWDHPIPFHRICPSNFVK